MSNQCERVELTRKDNGKALYLTKYTGESSKTDKNILMVHGLTYTQYVFDMDYEDYSMCKYFANAGYTVWRLDLGGYGKSEKYDNGWDVTSENAAADEICALEKICEVQGVSDCDLLGWSWGTITTAIVASKRPELIGKAVWIAPCFGGTFDASEVTEPFDPIAAANQFYGDKMEAMMNIFDGNILKLWAGCIAEQAAEAGKGRPNGGKKEIFEAGQKWLIDVPAVKVPVLIVAGDQDFYVNVDRCRQAEKELPEGSKFLLLEGAGHPMFLEKKYYKPIQDGILEYLNA